MGTQGSTNDRNEVIIQDGNSVLQVAHNCGCPRFIVGHFDSAINKK